MTEEDITTTFTYYGDSNRVKKIVQGTPDATTIYVNQYFEKTGDEITTYYYHGGKLVAQRKGIDPNYTLSYIHQDSLGSTSVMTDKGGEYLGGILYFPYGDCRISQPPIDDFPTDKLFTGQRLDSTGLYYYGARYYDPGIGRFISPDTIVPSPVNPQSLNRYSYCLNNPLKFIDPNGNEVYIGGFNVEVMNTYLDNYQYYYDCWDLSLEFLNAVNSSLYGAYYSLRSVAPELTNYLESSQDVIIIATTPFARSDAEFIPGYYGTHQLLVHPGIEAMLDKGLLSSGKFAGTLGHELFHGAIRIGTGVRDKFAANEAFAYSFGYAVGQKLGAEPDRLSTAMSDINPSIPRNQLNARIDDAGRFLYDNHPAYFRQTWWQKWITGGSSPLLSWSPEDKKGDRFLTVAKTVWIE